ncbi:MAG: hypothetical protein DRP11_04355 [Candidatus Aenigmatarchaeota archaeon]|nr:MAG: hypothetical protein DRP11_04355 [Candidatus Aenigmarchaeota archaeon]
MEQEIPWYERILSSCDPDLISAVKWLIKCGVKKGPEIARRLEVSPGTVHVIRSALRKKGMLPELGSRRKRKGKERKEGGKRRGKDVYEIFGLRRKRKKREERRKTYLRSRV